MAFNGKYTLKRINGNCKGGSAAELGSIDYGYNTWGLIFTSQVDDNISANPPSSMEVGFLLLDDSGKPKAGIVWLTSGKEWKTDATLARINKKQESENSLLTYIVGWAVDPEGVLVTTKWYGLSNNLVYYVAIINGITGKVINGPIEIKDKKIFWGRRDDPFRTASDGSVKWVYGEPNSNILNIGNIIS